jgi:3-oxoacyl-[acyl-carrier-protein] synthase III
MRRCRIESLGVSLPRRTPLRRGALAHAVAAGRRCLGASRYNPSDVRVLINTGVHRDGHVCEPAIAAYIQRRLAINVEFQGRRTLAFDLLNGGCGMLNGMHLMTSLMQAGEIHAGMVVSSEANSDRRPDPSYPYPASGAAVLLDLSPKSDVGFGAFAFHTNEQHAELFASTVSLASKGGRLLLRRHAELEDAYLAGAAPAVEDVLAKDHLRLEDVDLVVPAQISSSLLGRLPRALGVAPERVLDLSAGLADTHSTSVLLALKQAMDAGLLPKGKKALLLAFGSGVTVAAATYRF